MDRKAIGIDLGTTTSRLAVWHEGHVKVLYNEHGDLSTLNCVAFTDRGRLVGDPAEQQMVITPENTVYDMKRLIGRTYDHPEVQRSLKSWSFPVVNDAGKPSIEVQQHGEKERFYPEQISAMILANLKARAESALKTKVTDAVVTVPAYFNDAQRQATKDAGQIAGFTGIRLINEPTSAAIAYGLEKKSTGERNVLVYDLGRSTFDVTVLTITNLTFKVMSTCGDAHLGGRDFDNRVADFYVRWLKNKHNVDITGHQMAMDRLRLVCEKAKKTLASSIEAPIVVDNICDGIDLCLKLTRIRLDSLCLDLFQRTVHFVEKALCDASVDKSDIDDVVLVGGSTRIPRIQAMVKAFFKGKAICNNARPEETVVTGAAMQAVSLHPVIEVDVSTKHSIEDDVRLQKPVVELEDPKSSSASCGPDCQCDDAKQFHQNNQAEMKEPNTCGVRLFRAKGKESTPHDHRLREQIENLHVYRQSYNISDDE